MTRVLHRAVHIGGTTYPAGSIPPEHIADRITDPRAWHDPDAAPITTPAAAAEPGPAPDPAGHLYPAGAPDEGWTVKDLRAWADAHGLDLKDVSRKAQILEVIDAHPAEDRHAEDPA
ncbi:hypothetical protein [Micrococcus luteus]|uniref:hypothetical protein n=1 Tax=Micrococcus luteus TaxID=1270 RepID=UPI0036CA1464